MALDTVDIDRYRLLESFHKTPKSIIALSMHEGLLVHCNECKAAVVLSLILVVRVTLNSASSTRLFD